jgi:hypothetical protein
MKNLAAITIAVGILLSILPPTHVLADSCSCSANDGSCSASVTCPGGCTAFCGSNGACRASCNGSGGLGPDEPQDYSSITLRLSNSSSKQLASEVARVIGRDIVFLPKNTKATYNIEFSNAGVWDVLETLSKSGKVRIAGDDLETLKVLHKALVSGERINVCFRKTPLKTALNELAFLTGISIKAYPGEVQPLLNLTLKDATFKDIIAAISTQSGMPVMVAGEYVAAQ